MKMPKRQWMPLADWAAINGVTPAEGVHTLIVGSEAMLSDSPLPLLRILAGYSVRFLPPMRLQLGVGAVTQIEVTKLQPPGNGK